MNPSPAFKHQMLVANAGSGKTHALTTRIICLLLAGVPADRIAALTFTRKSAGEFLDELLRRLAEAAINPEKLQELARATGHRELSEADCHRLLAGIIEHFSRLGLGTIDSFFARIARQFPLESGLPEEFAIADSAAMARARERALAACFNQSTRQRSGLQAMIEQCRLISRRQGERNVFGTLLRQIEALHQRFLETPQGCRWGEAADIWREPPFAQATDPVAAADAFEQAALGANPELSDEAIDYLKGQLDAIRALPSGQTWNQELQSFIERKLSSEPKNNHLQLTRKKTGWLELTEDVRATRKVLLDSLYAEALAQSLERARGLYQFVADYEAAYAGMVRRAGLISFADITTLIAERAADGDDEAALDWRTQVAYRIDQRFDHWLLDEFQDTSRLQWTILRAFIEEVIMDDAAARSFFYVGDTKQAIYGWRGGEAELFREIFDAYQSIEAAPPLTQSWRSTQPVIDLVNQVFGNLDAIAESLQLPAATTKKWKQGWNPHEVAPGSRAGQGYAAWQAVAKDPDREISAQYETVRNILDTVRPIGNEIECAVLLRKNDDVAALAAYLQSHGYPVAVEGKSNPCTDNLLGSAVLAALRCIAHPEDRLAAAVARGLPCALAWGLEDLEAFREQSLQSIAEVGFAPTIQQWLEDALGHQTHPDGSGQEAFLRGRSEQLLASAEAFDARATASDGIDALISHIESTEIQEAEGQGVIRLMTIHQAKGLGFEMVIVCGLDRSGSGGTADELVLGPTKAEPRWGLLLPRKDIALQDPLLRKVSERLSAEAKTSELCSAYVALTRAKRALYVISDEMDDKSQATHFGRHLKLTLESGWEAGDPHWHQGR